MRRQWNVAVACGCRVRGRARLHYTYVRPHSMYPATALRVDVDVTGVPHAIVEPFRNMLREFAAEAALDEVPSSINILQTAQDQLSHFFAAYFAEKESKNEQEHVHEPDCTAFVWFHHIYSAIKQRKLSSFASRDNVRVLCAAGKPGLMCVSGKQSHVDAYLAAVRQLHWQCMRVRFILQGATLELRRDHTLEAIPMTQSKQSDSSALRSTLQSLLRLPSDFTDDFDTLFARLVGFKGKRKQAKQEETPENTAAPKWIVFRNDSFFLQTHVRPNARQSSILNANEANAEKLEVRLNAPPRDGAANDELVSFLRTVFRRQGVRADVLFHRGHKSRDKTVSIEADKSDLDAIVSALRVASDDI
ncbi:MAG: hypothetical protein MHM6MM_001043 [Cercozoa sp. M6MM]